MKRKRAAADTSVPEETVQAGEPLLKRAKWTDKQRVMVFCSRGITHRPRHLMMDLRVLLPHSKAETKLDRKDKLFVVNEVCDLRNCNWCVFFEMRKKRDCYMWIGATPHGPSARFLVENIHTMDEMKMTGNCLRGSRPVLSFDSSLESAPHYKLLRDMLERIFSTPNNHPKSKPFVDHVFTFSLLDDRIWFRNFQILEGGDSFVEVGPRFCLNLIRIFDGSFGGATLYQNPNYQGPSREKTVARGK